MPKVNDPTNISNGAPPPAEGEFYFGGFSSPNTTAIPDEVFDLVMPHLSEAELKVLFYIMRRTFGFKKQADAISLAQLTEGIRRKDGTVLDSGTGLSKPAVLKGVAGLTRKGIIWVEKRAGLDGRNEVNTYGLRFTGQANNPPEPALHNVNNYSINEYSGQQIESKANLPTPAITKIQNRPDKTNHQQLTDFTTGVNKNYYGSNDPQGIVNNIDRGSNNSLPADFMPPITEMGKQELPPRVNRINQDGKNSDRAVVKNHDPQHDRKQKRVGHGMLHGAAEILTEGNLAKNPLADEGTNSNDFSPVEYAASELQKFGLPVKKIARLLGDYQADYLLAKLTLVNEIVRRDNIKNPAGFLIWAIENNYNPSRPAVIAENARRKFPVAEALLEARKTEKQERAFTLPALPRPGIKSKPSKAASKKPANQTARPVTSANLSNEEILAGLNEHLRVRLGRPDLVEHLRLATLEYNQTQELTRIYLRENWRKRLIGAPDLATIKVALGWTVGKTSKLELV